jgi:hypothetical protein
MVVLRISLKEILYVILTHSKPIFLVPYINPRPGTKQQGTTPMPEDPLDLLKGVSPNPFTFPNYIPSLP